MISSALKMRCRRYRVGLKSSAGVKRSESTLRSMCNKKSKAARAAKTSKRKSSKRKSSKRKKRKSSKRKKRKTSGWFF